MADTPAIAAELRPLKSWQETVDCAVFARTGRGKVKVEMKGGTKFAVDRFRLYELREHGKVPQRISDRDLDALPWEGTGPDPLVQRAPAESGALV